MSDEWQTPVAEINKAIDKFVMPYPKLDPASVWENRKCLFGLDDGFSKLWDLDFFLNPPYSQIDDWLTHARFSVNENHVTGLCLLPMKPDQKWFAKHIGEQFEKVKKFWIPNYRIYYTLNGKRTRPRFSSFWVIL